MKMVDGTERQQYHTQCRGVVHVWSVSLDQSQGSRNGMAGHGTVQACFDVWTTRLKTTFAL